MDNQHMPVAGAFDELIKGFIESLLSVYPDSVFKEGESRDSMFNYLSKLINEGVSLSDVPFLLLMNAGSFLDI